MNIAIVYFSATGNTAKMAKIIEKKFAEFGCKVSMINITSYINRQEIIDLNPYNVVLFGAPVHARRAPRVMRKWLETLDGQGKKCSMFFTFGGFGAHPAHHSTRQILEKQHFNVVSSAEFLSAHTFNLGGWKAMEGRPDQQDFDIAKEYAGVTYARFTNKDKNCLRELEQTEHTEALLDAAETSRFKVVTQLPTRGGQDCSLCSECEESCPTGTIEAELGEADKARCIACLACVANCPEQVLKINDTSESWPFKLKKEKATEESLRQQKSKIYL